MTPPQRRTTGQLPEPSGNEQTVAPYYSDESVTLYLGDALTTVQGLPAGSVECIVTSPPYYGLRDYAEDGQYGLEASPAEYVETMRALFAECRRVLADDGTLWLNLGDSWVRAQETNVPQTRNPRHGYPEHSKAGSSDGATGRAERPGSRSRSSLSVKNLLGIPWRVAFALQDDGWVLRQEIIWAKRSCMPEAVKDRPTRSHEQVFLFSKRPAYWYDAEAIRETSEPEQVAHNERYARVYAAQADRAATTGQPGNNNSAGIHARPGDPGRNARSVWWISTQPFPAAHFATFPIELPDRCIRAGCKPGGIVLDPFSGSGTTGLAATKLGRRYVGIDLNRDYLDLSLRTRLAQSALIDEETA